MPTSVNISIEAGSKGRMFHQVEPDDLPRIWEALRDMLREQFELNRCASAVISVHFPDERCDHEVP